MNLLGLGHCLFNGYRNTGACSDKFNICSDIYAQAGVREALLVLVSQVLKAWNPTSSFKYYVRKIVN